MRAGMPRAQNTSRKRLSLLWILLVLVAPAILNFALASLAANSNEAVKLIAWMTFFGGPAAGILSAILLMRWKYGVLSSAAILGVIGLSILFSVVSFGLCFVGCAAGFTLSNG